MRPQGTAYAARLQGCYAKLEIKFGIFRLPSEGGLRGDGAASGDGGRWAACKDARGGGCKRHCWACLRGRGVRLSSPCYCCCMSTSISTRILLVRSLTLSLPLPVCLSLSPPPSPQTYFLASLRTLSLFPVSLPFSISVSLPSLARSCYLYQHIKIGYVLL